MRFAAPEWFLLAPVIALVVWRWRVMGNPLRVLCLVLLGLFLVRPQMRSTSHGLDVWVLADRSASAAASVEPRLAEWERIIESSKGADDRIFHVDFAAEAALRDPTAGVDLTGSRDGTRTGLAASYALSQMQHDRAARILVLTDGFATEPLDGLAERLLRQRVPLDYRIATEGNVRDFRVDSLTAPQRAQPGEPFLVEMRVSGPGTEAVPYEVLLDGHSVSHGKVEVAAGRGIARFTDRLVQPGGHRYTVKISPEGDIHPGNNVAERWVEITGGPRILLITGYTGDPLAAILRAQGFEVELAEEPGSLDIGRLQGAKAVILNNIPASKLPRAFLKAVDFFVREQGGGLLMAGGKASFACGGYFGSPIADLLPVSMELRQERRKLMTAMAIALDRSGSMTMPVGNLQKIDLADAGAARAVELLGPNDQVAVYAVDTEAHEIVGLGTVGKDAAALGERIRRITSAGGGIFVYTALKTSFEALQKSPCGQRHIIIFADANDALQEGGNYQELVERIAKAGVSVSVIGLGTDHDSGAELLKNIAAWGKGRVFFADNATDLPSIFEQETVAVARAAFLEEEIPLKPQAGCGELAARPLPWLRSVDGCNLSYLRPGATAGAISGDDYAAPLVAFWQRGPGRAAAVSFPLGGEFSARVRAWPQFGDFSQTLSRWLMGESLAPGIALRSGVDGTELTAELLFDSTWEKVLAQNPPRLVLAGEKAGEAQTVVWERMQPGRYRATASLQGGQVVRGAVQIGKTTVPFGPLQAASGAEWEMDPARIAELAAVSHASQGTERIDLSSIWKAPRRAEFDDVRRWLLPAVLILLLLETLLTRLGLVQAIGWGSISALAAPLTGNAGGRNPLTQQKPGVRERKAPVAAAPAPQATAPAAPEKKAGAPEKQQEAASESAASRRERFRRAKHGE